MILGWSNDRLMDQASLGLLVFAEDSRTFVSRWLGSPDIYLPDIYVPDIYIFQIFHFSLQIYNLDFKKLKMCHIRYFLGIYLRVKNIKQVLLTQKRSCKKFKTMFVPKYILLYHINDLQTFFHFPVCVPIEVNYITHVADVISGFFFL